MARPRRPQRRNNGGWWDDGWGTRRPSHSWRQYYRDHLAESDRRMDAEIAAKLETEKLEVAVLAPAHEREPLTDFLLRGGITPGLQDYARQMLSDDERQLIAEGRQDYLRELERRRRRRRRVWAYVKGVLVAIGVAWFVWGLSQQSDSCNETCARYYSTHYETIGAEP